MLGTRYKCFAEGRAHLGLRQPARRRPGSDCTPVEVFSHFLEVVIRVAGVGKRMAPEVSCLLRLCWSSGAGHVAPLEFPRETGLTLRGAGKAGNPFQTTQGLWLWCCLPQPGALGP